MSICCTFAWQLSLQSSSLFLSSPVYSGMSSTFLGVYGIVCWLASECLSEMDGRYSTVSLLESRGGSPYSLLAKSVESGVVDPVGPTWYAAASGLSLPFLISQSKSRAWILMVCRCKGMTGSHCFHYWFLMVFIRSWIASKKPLILIWFISELIWCLNRSNRSKWASMT